MRCFNGSEEKRKRPRTEPCGPPCNRKNPKVHFTEQNLNHCSVCRFRVSAFIKKSKHLREVFSLILRNKPNRFRTEQNSHRTSWKLHLIWAWLAAAGRVVSTQSVIGGGRTVLVSTDKSKKSENLSCWRRSKPSSLLLIVISVRGGRGWRDEGCRKWWMRAPVVSSAAANHPTSLVPTHTSCFRGWASVCTAGCVCVCVFFLKIGPVPWENGSASVSEFPKVLQIQ